MSLAVSTFLTCLRERTTPPALETAMPTWNYLPTTLSSTATKAHMLARRRCVNPWDRSGLTRGLQPCILPSIQHSKSSVPAVTRS